MTTILLGKECSPSLETDDSVLQRSEVHVVWAETTDAFIPLAREHHPDLVVLDPQVAGFDAFACARGIIAALDGKVAVIVIGNTADHERAEAAGVVGIVTRPLTQARLVEAIRRYAPLTERKKDRAEVAIKVAIVRSGIEGLAYTRDLATDGCFLLTHEPIAVGEVLSLSFQLPGPGGRDVRVEAEVVRVQPPGIAVRFTTLAPGDRVEIGRFLRSQGHGAA